MAGTRRRARRLALQYLYYVDLEGDTGDTVPFDDFVRSFDPGGADVDYAADLVRRTGERRSQSDGEIDAAAKNWDLERISAVERSILRIGCVELSPDSGVPPAAAIDEAVELAKEFADAASGGFVNGVLDAIRRSHPADAADATEEAKDAEDADGGDVEQGS